MLHWQVESATQYMEQFDSEIDALKEKTQILKNY